ncbi:MAG: response regulator [Flavobacteriales bacterium]|nr:response regulator [Flavobacteriales bacterium]
MKKEVINVLLIEDNPDDQVMFKEHFQEISFEQSGLTICSNLSEGIKILSEEKTDILLLDMSLPDAINLDGLQKIISQFTNVPVIILTGFRNPEIAIEAIQIGAQDYIVKGEYNSCLLEKSIRYAIERQKLIQEREVAEAALKVKNHFLDNMSHEIKTPLNAILGMSQLLSESNSSKKNKKYINAIRSAGKSLNWLVNDILDIVRAREGRLSLSSETMNVNKILKELTNNYEIEAGIKGIILNNNLDLDLDDVLVEGDPSRLLQILNNMVLNAMRFTDDGIIGIQSQLIEKKEGSLKVQFSVVDTGVGIPRDKLDSIFENFYQVDSSAHSRKYGGSGLGLSICKELVLLHNGQLWVESTVGKGSAFHFEINYALEVNQCKKYLLSVPEEQLDSRGLKVLIAEDNKLNIMLLREILMDWHYEVVTVMNGVEAVKALEYDTFDLVLMDIQMPGMGGLEATEKIRSKLKLNVPIIAVTANKGKFDHKMFIDAGMDGLVTKPYEKRELAAEITLVLDLEEKSIIKNDASTTSNDDQRHYSLDYLQGMVNGNDKIMKNAAATFVEEFPVELVELTTNIEKMEWMKTEKLAHKMKSSIDVMGIEQAGQLIREIEMSAKEQINLDMMADTLNKLASVGRVAILEIKNDLDV